MLLIPGMRGVMMALLSSHALCVNLYVCTSYLHVYRRCEHTVFMNNPCNAYLYTCILNTYISIKFAYLLRV
jgi:hypothetical protein